MHAKSFIICSFLLFLLSNEVHALKRKKNYCPGENPSQSTLNKNVCSCESQKEIRICGKTYINRNVMKKTSGTGVSCSVMEVKTGQIKIMKTFSNTSDLFREVDVYIKLNDSLHVRKLYSWVEQTNCKAMILENIEKTKLAISVRQRWINMLTALNDIHQRGFLNLDISKKNLITVSKNRTVISDFSNALPNTAANENISFTYASLDFEITSWETIMKWGFDKFFTSLEETKQIMEPLETTTNLDLELEEPFPNLEKEMITFVQQLQDVMLTFKNLLAIMKLGPPGPPADVWSACCTLYEMMYGESPYANTIRYRKNIRELLLFMTSSEVMSQLVHFRKFKFTYPPYNDLVLLETVQRCLRTDIEERPTIKELLDMAKSRKQTSTDTYKNEL